MDVGLIRALNVDLCETMCEVPRNGAVDDGQIILIVQRGKKRTRGAVLEVRKEEEELVAYRLMRLRGVRQANRVCKFLEAANKHDPSRLWRLTRDFWDWLEMYVGQLRIDQKEIGKAMAEYERQNAYPM